MKDLTVSISKATIGIEKLEPTLSWLKQMSFPYKEEKASLTIRVPVLKVHLFLKNMKQKNTLYLSR